MKDLSEISWPPKKIVLRVGDGHDKCLYIDGEMIAEITEVTFRCPLEEGATISIHYNVCGSSTLGHGILEIPVVGILNLTSYWGHIIDELAQDEPEAMLKEDERAEAIAATPNPHQ